MSRAALKSDAPSSIEWSAAQRHETTKKLNRVGLKATTPRLAILQIFSSNGQRHLRAADVHKRLVEIGRGTGLATVYRVLNQLTAVGILLRSAFDSDHAVYELQTATRHDHLLCLECGRVDDCTKADLTAKLREIAMASGYVLVEYELVLRGFCQSCRDKSPD